MNCPICTEKLMSNKKHGIESNYCPQCNEVWPTIYLIKKTIHKVFESSHKSNNFITSNGHIYSKTNDHRLIDDKKRLRELLYSLE